MSSNWRAAVGCVLSFASLPATAQEPEPVLELTVEGDRPLTAASARTVRDRDLQLRPMFTPEDILRVVPGLVLAQHQGGGKADQLLLRGFDADHGTDVAVSLDGVPINLPSHAHGQGYADLHFLIPEVIERVSVTKGPYFAELGDFDTAGAVDLRTRDRFETSFVRAEVAAFPTLGGARDDGTSRKFGGYRVLGVAATEPVWFAGEIYGTGGPFLFSERLQRFNLMSKATFGGFSLSGSLYGSAWNGSGQIPQRLVDAGLLDRYGAIDPTEGGDTQRIQLLGTYTAHPDAHSAIGVTLSLVRSSLTLFNDFTFFAGDPVHGDEIEQDDRRTVLYAAAKVERRVRSLIGSFGAQARSDDVAASLWHVERRARLPDCGGVAGPCVDTTTRELSAGLWGQLDWRPIPLLRLVAGLRADLFEFDVHSNRASGGLDREHETPLPPTAQRSIVSPKVSAVVSPVPELDLFLNFGTGFHSNDARAVVESAGSGALPRAVGYEAGMRARLADDTVELAAALWRLDLQSELVWNGDTGGTEASGATRRYGLELEARWQPLPWLWADVDVSLAKSRYKTDAGNGNAVALAPPLVITGGVSVRHPSGLTAALRLRHIGDRPASQLTADDGVPACTPQSAEDERCYLTAQGYLVLDGAVGYETRRFALTLFVENLTGTAFREAQFGNVSRVQGEAYPVQDVHFTPGNPFGAHLAGTFRF